MPTNSAPLPPAKVLLGCSKCGATLPDSAQFCLKCGKSVSSPLKDATVVEVLPPASLPRRQPKRRLLLWILLPILAGVVGWAVISDSTDAQQLQEFIGLKQDRIILDSSFSVEPHSFRYYKFALQEGSVNAVVVGQFTSASDIRNSAKRQEKPADKKAIADKDPDRNIEVYLLTQSAFTVWQNGFATSNLYESGKVNEGRVQADLPAGAEIYYLVFSNKAASKVGKAVHATVLLRYKSWLPEWLLRMKARLWELGWS